jgi:two-component system, NarL family, nitrate/nitrite response regulator NarL
MTPEQPAVRVVIADDHPFTMSGVKDALVRAGLDVVGTAADAPGAIAAALEHEPDVCVLDVHMPGGGGISAARRITAELAKTAVIMLTVSDDDEDLFAALRAGASGYLLKDMDPDRLPAAIDGILRGEAAVPRKLVSRIVEEYRGNGQRRVVLPQGRTVLLSEREHEILKRLRDGESTKEIAAALFVSQVTVRRHVSTAVRKLGVNDRAEALALLEG